MLTWFRGGVLCFLLACGERPSSTDGEGESAPLDTEESSSQDDDAAACEELQEDAWCVEPNECFNVLVIVCAGPVECCGIDATACCPDFTLDLSLAGMGSYECVLTALRDGTPSTLRVTHTFFADEPSAGIGDTIAVRGDGYAEVHRSVRRDPSVPTSIDTSRVRVKEPAFFDQCLAVGMPAADPCLAAICLRWWFETDSCSDALCCLQPLQYGDEHSLCG